MTTRFFSLINITKSTIQKTLSLITKIVGVTMGLFCLTVLILLLDNYLDAQYIKKQFNVISMDDAYVALRHHFVSGMTREEVIGILLEIDPRVKNQLHENITCDNSPFSDFCSETLCLFQQRVGWLFCSHFIYNGELLFLRITYD